MGWFLLGVGAVAVAAIVLSRRGQRPGAAEELSGIVLAAFGSDWTHRFGADETALRRALTTDGDPQLRAKIAAGVGVVDVKLARVPGPGRAVAATVLCEYRETRERSTAEFELPWDDAPSDVHAEFLRTGRSEVFRKWTAD